MSLDPSQNDQSDRPAATATKQRLVLSERQSRRRAQVLEHLTEPVVVAEDVGLLTDQANDIYLAFKPRNGWQDWLTSQIAVIMVRIDRCARIERRMRDWASYRAIDFWEEDQELEVATLATRLDRYPARVVAQLGQSPAGLEWLLRRWRTLARIEPNDWTAAQRGLAGRLVGDDAEVDPTAPGYAEGRVLDLEDRREAVAAADTALRGLVESDLCDDKVAGLTKLRRYSRSLQRQMKWYVDQFHVEHPDRWDDPMRKPAFLSRELIRDENARKPHWSFKPRATPAGPANPDTTAELPGEPTADCAETNFHEPLFSPVPMNGCLHPSHRGTAFFQSNPLRAAPAPDCTETKPTVRTELNTRLADAAPQPVWHQEEEVEQGEPITAARSADRPQRDTPPSAAARRAKSRRREALACVGGS